MILIKQNRPPSKNQEAQTDYGIMLQVAADLFLSELNLALNSANDKDNNLMKILKLDSIEDLAQLRVMAKTMIGHIKAKVASNYSSNGAIFSRPRQNNGLERDSFVEMHQTLPNPKTY